MKRTALAVACFGAVMLAGCGGSVFEGTWCPDGQDGKDYVVIKDGKITTSQGRVATYTATRNSIHAVEESGDDSNVILADDGTLRVVGDPKVKLVRCKR